MWIGGLGSVGWPGMPVEIERLDQLSDVDRWSIVKKPRQLDVQRALDRHAVCVGWGVAVRQIKGAKRR